MAQKALLLAACLALAWAHPTPRPDIITNRHSTFEPDLVGVEADTDSDLMPGVKASTDSQGELTFDSDSGTHSTNSFSADMDFLEGHSENSPTPDDNGDMESSTQSLEELVDEAMIRDLDNEVDSETWEILKQLTMDALIDYDSFVMENQRQI